MASEDFIIDLLKDSGKLTDAQLAKAREDVGIRAGTVLEVLILTGGGRRKRPRHIPR
jgi:hypothetical protein